MAYKPGIQYQKSKVTQTTSNSGGSGGSSSKEKTVPVNPLTYEFDPFSTFRVPESQVKTTTTADTQKIGSSSGNRFITTDNKTGYASSSVSEIRQGSRGQGGFVIATNKPIVNVSQGVANKIINERTLNNASSGQSSDGFVEKRVVLSVKERPQGTPSQSIDFMYNRPKPKNVNTQNQLLFQGGQKNDIRPDSNNNIRSDNGMGLGFGKTLAKEETGFEKRVRESVKRQTDFFNSEGFQRIDALANWVTFGKGTPIEKRSITGQSAQKITSGLFGWGISSGAVIISTGEKIAATGEGLFKNPKDTLKELKNSFGKVEQTSFSFLPGGTPINSEGVATVGTTAIFAGVSYPSFKNNPATRTTLTKVYPEKFVPLKDTNIKFVESYTEPTTRTQLIKLEGKKAETIHVTTSDLFKRSINERMFESKNFLETFKAQKESIITSAKPAIQGAGPFRNQNLLLNFYKSSPDPITGQPRAYLGYAGILKAGEKASSSRVIIGKPDIKLIRFTDEISRTPEAIKRQDLLGINRYQATTGSGKTFVPAENLKSISVEGQLITPSNYKGVPKAKEFGLTNTPGSRIIKVGESKFTYYKQVKPNNNILTKISNILDEVSGRNYYKMELIDAKTGKVKSSRLIPKTEKTLDIGKYNESYGKTSYVSSQPVIPFGLYSSSSRSKNRSSGSKNNSSSNVSSNLTSSSIGSSIGSSNISSSNNSSPQKSIISGLKSSSSTSSSSKITSSGSNIISSNKPSYGYNSTTYKYNTPSNNTPPSKLFGKLKGSDNMFSVDVKSKGKFISVGEGLNLKDAIKLGKDLTGRTASRSFKIKNQAGKPLKALNLGGNYYKKGDTFIEKVGVAINTGGELKQITFKGIATQKRKKVGII